MNQAEASVGESHLKILIRRFEYKLKETFKGSNELTPTPYQASKSGMRDIPLRNKKKPKNILK
jgi:hypothetical protein